MRICAVVKYPPIQGGVSALSHSVVRSLAEAGHEVHVVTNSDEVEDECRVWIAEEDRALLDGEFASGGRITVTATGWAQRDAGLQIPRSDLYVTRLAGLATDVVRTERCDLVYSFFLEPYALAGSLAAGWTGVPHVVQHAGGDRTRLLAEPELGAVYREVLRGADAVVSADRRLTGLGVAPERVRPPLSGFLPGGWGRGAPGDRQALTPDRIVARLGPDHPAIHNPAPLPEGVPVLAVYGKVGPAKGTYELVDALAELRRDGVPFSFLVVGGGSGRAALLAVLADRGLSDVTWTLPFVPHWRVPEVLSAATAVCCLEHGVAQGAYPSALPTEVLAAGVCLVLSGELLDGQPFRDALVADRGAVVVPDPTDIGGLAKALAGVLGDPRRTAAVAAAGGGVLRTVGERELAAHYEGIFTAALAARAAGAAGSGAALSADPAAGGPGQEAAADGELAAAMPATVRLLGEERWARALAAAEPAPPGRRDATLRRAEAVRDHLGGTRPAAPEGPDSDDRADLSDAPARTVAGAVAAYECHQLWLETVTEEEETSPPVPRRGAHRMLLSRAPGLAACFPEANPLVRKACYPQDIERLVDEVLRGAWDEGANGPSDGPCPGPTATYLFVKTGSMIGATLRVNADTLWLLSLCDGTRSLADVVEICGTERGMEHDGVLRAVRSLGEIHAVLL